MFTHFDIAQGHLNGKSVTSKYFQVIGNIHDIKSYSNTDNSLSLFIRQTLMFFQSDPLIGVQHLMHGG